MITHQFTGEVTFTLWYDFPLSVSSPSHQSISISICIGLLITQALQIYHLLICGYVAKTKINDNFSYFTWPTFRVQLLCYSRRFCFICNQFLLTYQSIVAVRTSYAFVMKEKSSSAFLSWKRSTDWACLFSNWEDLNKSATEPYDTNTTADDVITSVKRTKVFYQHLCRI